MNQAFTVTRLDSEGVHRELVAVFACRREAAIFCDKARLAELGRVPLDLADGHPDQVITSMIRTAESYAVETVNLDPATFKVLRPAPAAQAGAGA